MKSYIQVLGTETGDTTPAVMFVADGQRYLFNAGEGTQRFCIENRVRLARLSNVFLTRVKWDTCGGLPGMLLSLASAGNQEISVHGGKNLNHFMASTRHFVYRMSSLVRTFEFPDEAMAYEDENLRALPVTVYPVSAKRTFEDGVDGGSKRAKVLGADGEAAPVISISEVDPSQGSLSQSTTTPTAPDASWRRTEDSYSRLSAQEALVFNREIIGQMFSTGEDLSVDIGSRENFKARADKPVAASGIDYAFPNIQDGKLDHNKLVRLPNSAPNLGVTSYICNGATLRGKFLVDKANELGVPPRFFGRLCDKKEYVAEDGTTVVWQQVMEPDRPGPVFIVVDCPSTDYIAGIDSDERFAKHYTNVTTQPVSLIIHILGDDVIDSPTYRTWMKKFGETTEHIIISRQHCAKPITFKSSATNIHRLNALDPDLFKIPFYTTEPVPFDNGRLINMWFDRIISLTLFSLVETLPSNIQVAESMIIYNTEPTRELDTSEVRSRWSHTNPEGKVLRKFESPHFDAYKAAAATVRGEILATLDSEEAGASPGDDVLLCTLGTGASLPSRFRNVSSTLVHIPGDGCIMFDAGEGTYGQLYRRFNNATEGPTLDELLAGLKFLFISHMHADHHLGAIKLIQERKRILAKMEGPKPTLYIACPPHYITWLDEFADCDDFGFGVNDGIEFITNDDITGTSPKSPNLDGLKAALNLSAVEAISVEHSPYAYALSVAHTTGFKIVYSGDCRPNLDLMKSGGDADVLIHEATFQNDELGSREAQKKRHSTTTEAVIVAARMKARWVLLTHFSQRYPCTPSLGLDLMSAEDQARRRAAVGLAFDLMAVKLGQMRRLPKFFSPLEKLYPKEIANCPDVEEEDLQSMDNLSGDNPKRDADRRSGFRGGRGGNRGRSRGRGRGF
ncbi:Zinc phosphodiesterase ELAC protein 2 [Geranomyces variabilis]|nr:Zinc phosphodiesterase ELAC protein 2 [Geranomyces variabilis]